MTSSFETLFFLPFSESEHSFSCVSFNFHFGICVETFSLFEIVASVSGHASEIVELDFHVVI